MSLVSHEISHEDYKILSSFKEFYKGWSTKNGYYSIDKFLSMITEENEQKIKRINAEYEDCETRMQLYKRKYEELLIKVSNITYFQFFLHKLNKRSWSV